MAQIVSANFLDVDTGAICKVLSLLTSPTDLIRCAATCSTLLKLVVKGDFAARLWQRHCEDALGVAATSIHKAALDAAHGAAAYDAVGLQEQSTLSKERTYRLLYSRAHGMDDVCWHRHDLHSLNLGSSVAIDRIARAGHSATVLNGGAQVLFTGGLAPWTIGSLEVYVADMIRLTLNRHRAVQINPTCGTVLLGKVQKALGRQHDVSEGTLVAVIGGRQMSDTADVVLPDILEVLWLNKACTKGMWVHVQTFGPVPGRRWNHTADAFDGGKKVVVFGGECAVPYQGALNTVCILDVNSLMWSCPAECKTLGATWQRSLHCSCIWPSPDTGHEHLVVVAGTKWNRLASMQPAALDLTTYEWHPSSAQEGGSPGSAGPLRRQRCASCRVSRDWLLISGGCPTADLMSSDYLLGDLWKLHLPTLAWGKQPVRMHRRFEPESMRVAGHTLEGFISFGGCCIMGNELALLACYDVMLLGTSEDYKMQGCMQY